MRKALIIFIAVLACLLFGCATDASSSWQLRGKAITGAGAFPGKDYIAGLKPSDGARRYFAKLDKSKLPVERLHRGTGGDSRSGVKFLKNGGIQIPPGVTITYTNKGYCLDPHLPAPKAGDEFQLIPMTQLIPGDLQSTYLKLAAKGAPKDYRERANMQHLMWALRTAGTDAPYASNLSSEQVRILDSCSGRPGSFAAFHAREKAKAKMMKELIGITDSYLNVKIGGVTYTASDLLEPAVGFKKINDHLNQLIDIGQNLPVERTGLNYGEIYPGIYSDVRGIGPLEYKARIANSTNKPFNFYPTFYVAQAGSPVKNASLGFFAMADSSMKQRVTAMIANNVGATCGGPMQEFTIDFNDLEKWTFKNVEKAKNFFQKNVPNDAADNACREYYSFVIKVDDKLKITTIKGVDLSSTVTSTGQRVAASKFDILSYCLYLEKHENVDIVAVFHTHPLGDKRYSDADMALIRNLNNNREKLKRSGNAQMYIYDAKNKTWVSPIQ